MLAFVRVQSITPPGFSKNHPRTRNQYQHTYYYVDPVESRALSPPADFRANSASRRLRGATGASPPLITGFADATRRTVGRDDDDAAAEADKVFATSFVDSDLRRDNPCCRSSSRLNLASSSSDNFLSTGARSARSIAGQGSKGPRTNRPRGSSANTCFRTRASSSVTSSSSSS